VARASLELFAVPCDQGAAFGEGKGSIDRIAMAVNEA